MQLCKLMGAPLLNASSVTNMATLFSDMTSFNSVISEWDTALVTAMEWMFYRAASFDGDLSDWVRKQTPPLVAFAASFVFRAFNHIPYYYAMVSHTHSVKYWKCC